MKRHLRCFGHLVLMLAFSVASAFGADVTPPVSERYSSPEVEESPDFQRHVIPLAGRLGCNGRACHGSFQGQGGFRLSLFGYDFKADHEALTQGEEPRVDLDNPAESLILQKPTMQIDHEGGERMKVGGWEHHLLKRWIEDGAKWNSKSDVEFVRLEVTPDEIIFAEPGESVQLKVVVYWSDGSAEDVTPLARFQTNDDSIATVDENGVVTAVGKGDTHIVSFYDNGVAPTPAIMPLSDQHGPNFPEILARTKIDELILAKLQKLGAVPSEVCSDEEFLRRVSLDVTGALPTADEVVAFVNDDAPDKRSRKVDELLSRPTYVAWWTTHFCDMMGAIDSNMRDAAFRGEQARQWYDWLYARIEQNMPYDKIVEGVMLATSRLPGESFDEFNERMAEYYRGESPKSFAERPTMPYFWARRNTRNREDFALAFSHSFLGLRIECAQCHKHPFDQWTQQDFRELSLFFNNVRYGTPVDSREEYFELQAKYGFGPDIKGKNRNELRPHAEKGEVIFWPEVYVMPADDKKPASALKLDAAILGGRTIKIEPGADGREDLMNWMRQKENPYFAKALVNRVWANYFGVGIIDPPDDQNLANPPSNAALLDYLATGFYESGFDLKWLHREITSSDAYQREWRPNETNRLDERNFSHAIIRRLPAEVVHDAIYQATAGDEELKQLASNPTLRAIGPNNVLTRGGERNIRYMLTTFGKPDRMTNCDCERSNEPSILQTVYLRNDEEMLRMIDREGGWIQENLSAWNKARNTQLEELASVDERLRKRRDELKSRLEAAEKAEDNPRAKRIRSKIDKISQRLEGIKSERATLEASPPDVSQDALKAWAEDAYRRTLTRMPTETELQRCMDHIHDSATLDKGMRDVLWALLNTKEFIVNH